MILPHYTLYELSNLPNLKDLTESSDSSDKKRPDENFLQIYLVYFINLFVFAAYLQSCGAQAAS